jgi:uncharacterized membrane protein
MGYMSRKNWRVGLKVMFYFLVFAFLGWIFETVCFVIFNHQLALRGILFVSHFGDFTLVWGLPMIPLYGFAGIIFFFLRKFRQKICKHPLLLFVLATVALTVLELAASYVCQLATGREYWFYNGGIFDFCNFDGRITLISSLAWGVLGTLSILYLIPLMERIFDRLQKSKVFIWTIAILFIYLLLCLSVRERLFPSVYSV